jgi:DNA polymerase-3 subunit epsilon
MRELILDTETTGLNPSDGHRITEIGIVELVNRMPTGKTYHQYLDPEREVDAGATRITGQTWEQLKGQPKFADIVEALLEFLGGDPIVAHNAPFDMGFLNHELHLMGREKLPNEVIDSLMLSRKKFPGSRHSLDALCSRFEVDSSKRTFHGALLDAQLLADVYLELTGGRQNSFFSEEASADDQASQEDVSYVAKAVVTARIDNIIPASTAEKAHHQAWVGKLEKNFWGSGTQG